MIKKIAKFFKLSISIVFGITLLFGSVGCFWSKQAESNKHYEKEVGDFIVWFYKDHCEIYGTTDLGKKKRFLVIPEYIYGIRVDSLGYRSLEGAIDMVEGDLTWPKMQGNAIEKIYFESAIDCYAWMDEGYVGANFKKIMYPEISEYISRFRGLHVCFPRMVYEKAIEEGKIDKNDSKYPANISYYYNCEHTESNDYYFIDDCDYGEKIEFIPPEPTRVDYTFDGWYKEPECINKWDFEADTLPEEKTEQKPDPNSQYGVKEVTVYQETILYAKWIEEQTDHKS